jgi:hypothetical protein
MSRNHGTQAEADHKITGGSCSSIGGLRVTDQICGPHVTLVEDAVCDSCDGLVCLSSYAV